jgi:lipopolysaccharide transport system ATP-binding protein
MPIIEVNDVVKRYRLGQMQTLRETFKNLVRGRSAQPATNSFNALDGVTFSVEPGEVLGIIGTNGAGKSTLLKVLAGITTPTTGKIIARGRVAPLIEVGAGLLAELTGRENVYLNGVILGMSVREIKKKFDEIVSFAELEKFIDTPVKRYSSGMHIRLGFAIATAVESDILIVDEVLAVGDLAFQRKCFDRIEDIIKNQRKTILLVSHNIRQVERLCTRAVLLDRGRIIQEGATKTVCQQFFERTNARVMANVSEGAAVLARSGPAIQKADVKLLSLDVLDADGQPIDVVVYRRDFAVQVRFSTPKTLNNPVFNLGIHTADMLYLANHQSDLQHAIEQVGAGEYTIRCVFRRLPLVPGVYSLRFSITAGVATTPVYYGENLAHFQVTETGADEVAPDSAEGFFALDADWTAPAPSVRPQAALETA